MRERDLVPAEGACCAVLLAIVGCGILTAAKILGETAGVDRFASKDALIQRGRGLGAATPRPRPAGARLVAVLAL